MTNWIVTYRKIGDPEPKQFPINDEEGFNQWLHYVEAVVRRERPSINYSFGKDGIHNSPEAMKKYGIQSISRRRVGSDIDTPMPPDHDVG